jgi:hypothetical protein
MVQAKMFYYVISIKEMNKTLIFILLVEDEEEKKLTHKIMKIFEQF